MLKPQRAPWACFVARLFVVSSPGCVLGAGGATALEGSSTKAGEQPPTPNPAASGAPGKASTCQVLGFERSQNSQPSYAAAAGIRLAGATHDVHIFDVRSGKWEKITPQGEPPSPRAAHAAAAVGNMVVIQVHSRTAAIVQAGACMQWADACVCLCRAVSGLRAWRQRICMCWTSPTLSALGGTGANLHGHRHLTVARVSAPARQQTG